MTTTPFQTGSILLLVGTKQGLFLLSSADRHRELLIQANLIHPQLHESGVDSRNQVDTYATPLNVGEEI